MTKYRFHYFDVRGRGEVARLMFAAAGVKYEDLRYTKEQWAEKKKEMPFGQLPCLEVDGKKYAQSIAIFNYLARELGFYSKKPLECLCIDQVMQLQTDLMMAASKFMMEQDEAKKAELMMKFGKEDIPRFYGQFTALLKENKTGYFVGKHPTLADFAVFDAVMAFEMKQPGMLENFPELKEHQQKMLSNDKLKTYIDSRKETQF